MKNNILLTCALAYCASAGAADIELTAAQMDEVAAGSASASAIANALGFESATTSTLTDTFIGSNSSSAGAPSGAGGSAAAALAKILGLTAPSGGGAAPNGSDDSGPQIARSQSSSSVNTNGAPATPATTSLAQYLRSQLGR